MQLFFLNIIGSEYDIKFKSKPRIDLACKIKKCKLTKLMNFLWCLVLRFHKQAFVKCLQLKLEVEIPAKSKEGVFPFVIIFRSLLLGYQTNLQVFLTMPRKLDMPSHPLKLTLQYSLQKEDKVFNRMILSLLNKGLQASYVKLQDQWNGPYFFS